MTEIAYLLIGSNMNDREEMLLKALDAISGYINTEEIKVSSLYETEPVGIGSEDDLQDFLNTVVAVGTDLNPFTLLKLIQETEYELGRIRHEPVHVKHSRIIDIDILLFGERIIFTRNLIIPHPELHERRFVLEPLSEIAGNMIHPLFNLTIDEIKNMNTDKHYVKPYSSNKGARWPLKS
ncbi:MAG: 2-amino-4-hydroxy-6-hydroxymethyldihydropteridine diphosphokinase [Deltaproteobacteria bacterium]|nr:2-amino-4-hydroxy-6-hydroxymethyldihydropteridine diphosphokinase [Deltaproteobacteria bacterium]MCL5878389.1 2-amino-4-hydroxy-6-hydroxymethyldihydropteridine diphosphokinase [Deltaproteobacteria bacterium]